MLTALSRRCVGCSLVNTARPWSGVAVVLVAEPDKSIDPRVVTLWRLQRVIRLALVGLPFAAVAGAGVGALTEVAFGVAVAGCLIMHSVVMLLLWPSLEYRAFRYAVRQHDLLVRSGVLFRRWSSIPLNRIQHLDTRQGPLERILGLSRLQVYTAAGVSADGSIPGLAEEDAERLRDELARRGGDDGV